MAIQYSIDGLIKLQFDLLCQFFSVSPSPSLRHSSSLALCERAIAFSVYV